MITYLVILNGNISDVVENVVEYFPLLFFVFNTSLHNVSYVLVKIVQWGATL